MHPMSPSLLQFKMPGNTTPPATPPLEEELPHLTSNKSLVRCAHTSQAYQIVEQILLIANELTLLHNLKPSSRVNALFGQLVSLCIRPHRKEISQLVLEDGRVVMLTKKLRGMCAEGEAELESYWAQAFLENLEHDQQIPNGEPVHTIVPRDILKLFPYYQNYVDLCNLELSTVLAVLSQHTSLPTTSFSSSKNAPLSVGFIGSGPLPFTSFMFANNLPCSHVVNIDNSYSAIQLSSRLATCLGYRNMSFLHQDAANLNCVSDLDVVFLAALVGMSSQDKTQIIRNVVLGMKEGSLLCVRSAVDLRGLLYPVVDFNDDLANCGLELVVEVRPWNHIVNSTLVMRVVR